MLEMIQAKSKLFICYKSGAGEYTLLDVRGYNVVQEDALAIQFKQLELQGTNSKEMRS